MVLGLLKGYYLKRIPASTVQELSVPELQELVRRRMGEALRKVPDEEIIGKGRKFYFELFAVFFANVAFLYWIFFA